MGGAASTGEIGADTGEVPLFKPKSDVKQTNEIFFKKKAPK